MALFVHRPLGDCIMRMASTPVVIVEGARAVGKTTMARDQIAGSPEGSSFSYVTLADSSTREEAKGDLPGWLRRLKRPTIIDEAQLLPGLPLELKELVDRVGAGFHFLLTGSASIGRSSLGGSDPLARRAQRFTMHPLTRWEIREQNGCLVDLLFDGELVVGSYNQLSDKELLDVLRIGGMPGLVFPHLALTRSQVFGRISSDLDGLLTDEVLPGADISVSKARAVLQALLSEPGGILNVSKLSSELELNKRTVEGYIARFGQLFILHWLQNMATSPRRQDFARAKIHPVDTSFAVWALERSGTDILESRERFGQLLESHVVHELLAAQQWSRCGGRAFYWRDTGARTPEVDLVLVDERDRAVAIEMKAATTVSGDDLRGIVAFAKKRTLHRGFVFYRGDQLRQMADNIWALPMSVLENSSSFRVEEVAVKGTAGDSSDVVSLSESLSAGDDAIFLSFVAADDDALHGKIVQFSRYLVDRYALFYGENIRLFVDKQSSSWGESLRERLSQESGAATVLLCALTPRYLQNDSCRRDVIDFTTAVNGSTRMLLPMMWVDIRSTDNTATNDPVLSRIVESQYIDVHDLLYLELGSAEYDRRADEVARRLKEAIDARNTRGVGRAELARVDGGAADESDDGVVKLLAELPALQANFESAAHDFGTALDQISDIIQREQIPSTGGAAFLGTFRKIRNATGGPRFRLDSASENVGGAWKKIEQLVEQFLQLGAAVPEAGRTEMAETISALEQSLEIPGLEPFENTVATLGKLSKDMRPLSQSLTRSLQLSRGIQEAAKQWQARLSSDVNR